MIKISTILGTLSVVLQADPSGFDSAMRNSTSSIENFAKIAAGATLAAGAAVTAFGAKGIADFVAFENQMNEVFTLLPGITDSAMGDMTSAVKDFSREFGALPNEVVPALYQAISASVPADNVFSFLETAQKAAVGGVSTLETAVDGITSIVNAYGSEVISAAEASDLMFTAVRLGKTDFTQLSQSLFNVIPTASSLGVSFGDVAAGLATITAQGTPTSVATTQMRQLFVELAKDGGKAGKMFQELSGSTFADFIAAGGNVQDALKLMEGEAASLGVGVNQLFSTVEAGNAALALTGSGAEMFTSALEQMGTAAGATDLAFDRMDSGIQASINRIKAGAATLFLDVGERLAPVFSGAVDSVLAIMPALSDGIVSAFETIAGVLSIVYEATVPNLIAGFQGLESNTNNIFTAIGAFIRNSFDTATTVIESVRLNVIPALEGAFTFLEQHSDTIFGSISAIVSGSFALIEAAFMVGKAAWENILKPVWEAIQPLVTAIMNSIVPVIQTAFETVTNIFRGVAALLEGDFSGAFGFFKDAASAAVNGVLEVAGNLGAGILATLPNLQSATVQMIDTIGTRLNQLVENALIWGRGTVTSLGNGIIENLSHLTTAAGEIVTIIRDTLAALPAHAVQLGKDIVEGLIGGIRSMADSANNALATWSDNMIAGIDRVWRRESPSKVMVELGHDIVRGLIVGIETMSTPALTAAEDFSQKMIDTFSSVGSAAVRMGDMIGGGVGAGISALGNLASSIGQIAFGGPLGIISGIVGIVSGIASLFGAQQKGTKVGGSSITSVSPSYAPAIALTAGSATAGPTTSRAYTTAADLHTSAAEGQQRAAAQNEDTARINRDTATLLAQALRGGKPLDFSAAASL